MKSFTNLINHNDGNLGSNHRMYKCNNRTYEAVPIPGDGNCLFTAIATIIPNMNQNQLRQQVANYIIDRQNQPIEQGGLSIGETIWLDGYESITQ